MGASDLKTSPALSALCFILYFLVGEVAIVVAVVGAAVVLFQLCPSVNVD